MNDQNDLRFPKFFFARLPPRVNPSRVLSLQLEDASAQAAVRLLMLCGGGAGMMTAWP